MIFRIETKYAVLQSHRKGVTKDAYSSFYEKVYEQFDGEFVKIPSLSMDEEDLLLIGKIITHAFITQYLIQLCSIKILHFRRK